MSEQCIVCGESGDEDWIMKYDGVEFLFVTCKDHLKIVDHVTDVLALGLILQGKERPDCWVCREGRDHGVHCSLHTK